MIRMLLSLLVLASLGACGLKKDLVLPDHEKHAEDKPSAISSPQ